VPAGRARCAAWPAQARDRGGGCALEPPVHPRRAANWHVTRKEPALGADRWPWPNLDVFVLGSHRPAGTPDNVVFDSDPGRLLSDVHLVGGPRTIETFRALGALDKLGLIVLPFFVGEGMRLTPSLSTDATLTLESHRSLPGGYVELLYSC
jgi:dihydrofolate reductase